MPAPERAHIPGLDGLRGIACLMVLVVHSASMSGMDAWPSYVQAMGACGGGVDLFFVLSGFLITGILVAARGQAGYFRTFYARRALRIMPVYYLALVLFFLVLRPFLTDFRGYRALSADQGWFWLHGANWLFCIHGKPRFAWMSHFWSLAIEEQFYLVWPLVVWACSRRTLIAVASGLIVASPIVSWWLAAYGYEVASQWSTPVRADLLAMGALVAVLPADRIRVAVRWLGAAGLVYLAVGPWPALGATAMGLVGCAAVMLATTSSGPLTWAPLCWFGRRSYGVYVYHLPIMGLASLGWYDQHMTMVQEGWAKAGPLTATAVLWHIAFLILTAGVTCVFAEVSWRYMEAPALSLRRLLLAKPRAQLPFAAAPTLSLDS